MLNNYGVHYIDQLMYLTGFEAVTSAHCHLFAAATRGDADDVVKAWLQLESGLLLDLEINEASALLPGAHSATDRSDHEVQIFGRYGTAMLTEDGTAFRLRFFNPAEAAPLELFTDLAAPDRDYSPGDHALPWKEELRPLETEGESQIAAVCQIRSDHTLRLNLSTIGRCGAVGRGRCRGPCIDDVL
jgi:predicted dehydrogenase